MRGGDDPERIWDALNLRKDSRGRRLGGDRRPFLPGLRLMGKHSPLGGTARRTKATFSGIEASPWREGGGRGAGDSRGKVQRRYGGGEECARRSGDAWQVVPSGGIREFASAYCCGTRREIRRKGGDGLLAESSRVLAPPLDPPFCFAWTPIMTPVSFAHSLRFIPPGRGNTQPGGGIVGKMCRATRCLTCGDRAV
jgi:hypothetical protein